MVSRVRYYPYGGIRTQEGTIPTDKLFTGQQLESADGVYHYNARLYNTDIGRFPQADTIIPEPQDPAAYNRYSYVANNPVNCTDPTGRRWAGQPYYPQQTRTYTACGGPMLTRTCAKVQNTVKLEVYKESGWVQVAKCWVKTKRWWEPSLPKLPSLSYKSVFAFYEKFRGGYEPHGGVAKENTWYLISNCSALGAWRYPSTWVRYGSIWDVPVGGDARYQADFYVSGF